MTPFLENVKCLINLKDVAAKAGWRKIVKYSAKRIYHSKDAVRFQFRNGPTTLMAPTKVKPHDDLFYNDGIFNFVNYQVFESIVNL
jgi:hypothetical protein